MKSLSVERPHTSKTYGKDESPIFTPVNNAKVSWQKSPQILLNSNIKSRGNLFKTARFSNDVNKKLAKKLDNIEYGFAEKETTTRSAYKAKTPLSESASIYMRTAETFLSNGVERTEYDTLSSFKDLVNSKKINQRGILERSYKISQLRKKTDDGLRPEKPKSALKNSYSSAKLSSDKTLTRFVDQLILAGSLPLEAVEYFSPESAKNKTEKSPTSATHSNKPSISIKSPRNQSKESKPETPTVDIIPRWLRAFPKFGNSVGAKKKNAQNPIFRILTRNPNERDLAQVTFIAKWLSNIQIFSKLHYDKLVELGKVLEPIYLNEGEVLCNVGDAADCAYIVYEGQIEIYTKPVDIERWIGKAGAGEVLGKQALEQPGRRTAKLVASKPTYVVALGRQNYKNVLGETKPVESASNSLIYNFVISHDFLKTFSEVKKHMLTNHLTLQKYLKNEVVYHMEAPADRLFMVMSGKVVRRMPVTIDKANKWPTGLQDWRICKIIKTYSVTLPIQVGEIFGVSEMIDVAKRKEQVLIDEDAQILTLTRDAFYQIFEEEDVFKFQKKVHEDDRKKAEKIKRMFEQQEKLHKIKTVAMADAFNFSLNNRNFSSFREVTEKTAEWKKLEKGMTQVKSRDKVVVSVQEIIKDVHSVYET